MHLIKEFFFILTEAKVKLNQKVGRVFLLLKLHVLTFLFRFED